MVCGDDGIWIGAVPVCVGKIINVTLVSIRKLTCQPGFKLNGGSEIACHDDGKWVLMYSLF